MDDPGAMRAELREIRAELRQVHKRRAELWRRLADLPPEEEREWTLLGLRESELEDRESTLGARLFVASPRAFMRRAR